LDRRDTLQGIFLVVPFGAAALIVWALVHFAIPPIVRPFGISDINAIDPDKLPVVLFMLLGTFCAFLGALYIGYACAVVLVRGRYTAREIHEAIGCPDGLKWGDALVRRILAPFTRGARGDDEA
jgi:hypothetical protein